MFSKMRITTDFCEKGGSMYQSLTVGFSVPFIVLQVVVCEDSGNCIFYIFPIVVRKGIKNLSDFNCLLGKIQSRNVRHRDGVKLREFRQLAQPPEIMLFNPALLLHEKSSDCRLVDSGLRGNPLIGLQPGLDGFESRPQFLCPVDWICLSQCLILRFA